MKFIKMNINPLLYFQDHSGTKELHSYQGDIPISPYYDGIKKQIVFQSFGEMLLYYDVEMGLYWENDDEIDINDYKLRSLRTEIDTVWEHPYFCVYDGKQIYARGTLKQKTNELEMNSVLKREKQKSFK